MDTVLSAVKEHDRICFLLLLGVRRSGPLSLSLKLTVFSSFKAIDHTCGNVTALSPVSLLLLETEQPAHSFYVLVKFCDIHTGRGAAANA